MLSRRSFCSSVSGLLGLLGLGQLSGNLKAQEIKNTLPPRPGKWSENWFEVIKRELEKHGVLHLENPNNCEDWASLIGAGGDQLEQTGLALFWKVPDAFGSVKEVYLIPTQCAFPHSATEEYPDGFYHIAPFYGYPSLLSNGYPIIPAPWMIRVKATYPNQRYDGYSPLQAMRLHIDEVEAIDRARWLAMQTLIEPKNFKVV